VSKSQPKRCIFKLFNVCHVAERSNVNIEFGGLEWIQTICSICIKSVYARRFKRLGRLTMSKYSVVNTL
jgi:hypothetical protein